MQAMNATETTPIPDEPVYVHYDTAFPSMVPASTTNGAVKSAKPKSVKPCVIKSNTIREFVEIPQSERKNLLANGAAAKKQNSLSQLAIDISRQHGVEVDINSSKSQSLTIVISGEPENVANAKCAIVRSLQTQSKVELRIEPKYHRFIVGKSGSTLIALERETTTNIQVPSPNKPDSDIVTITGPKHGCDAAKRKIMSIVDSHAKLGAERLMIPKMYHAFIKGPRRCNITRWTDTLKVRIDMAPPSSNAEDICISGDKVKVDQVVAEMQAIYKTNSSSAKRCVINVPKAQHRLVFGPKGSGLDDILDKTGVSVELPQTETDEVVLIGPPAKMGAAMSLVLERATSSIRDEIVAPNRFHKVLIGKSGSALAALLEGYQDRVRVEFGSQTDRIELDGPTEDVAAVKERLVARLKELEHSMAIESIKVPSKYHGLIVGRDGANIRKIRQKHNCQISINQQLNETSEIVVEGEAKNISLAVQEIREMVKRLENEKVKDLIIEPDIQMLLRTPVGGAPPVRALYDEFPKVSFYWPVPMDGKFNPTDPSNQVCQLSGQRQEVDACADKLIKLVKSSKECNYHHEFRVYKEFRATFFARENNKVREILNELQCRLQHPPTGGSDGVGELWWVVGREKQVHEAVDRIDALQRQIMNMKEVRLPIPSFVLAKAVGKDAPRLRSIKEQCDGVSFKFPRASPAESSAAAAKEIIVYGPSEGVAKAQKLIEELNNKVAELCEEAVVPCDKKFHGMLIGRSGQNIAAFREKHKVELVFPDRYEINPALANQIHILGSKASVPAAKKELLDQIKILEDEVELSLSVPEEFLRNVRQAHNRLQEGVRLIIKSGGGKKEAAETPSAPVEVKLAGPQALVETAKQTLSLLVDDLVQYSKLPPREFLVKEKSHARVIGRMKNQLPSLEADYRVIIKVDLPLPSRDQPDPEAVPGKELGKVAVYGSPEQIDSLWEEAFKPYLPISEKFTLEKSMHRYLVMAPVDSSPKKQQPATKKGDKDHEPAQNKVTELQNVHGVQVKLPPMAQTTDADFVTITGTPAQLKAARAQLDKWLVQWEQDKADRLARSYEEKMDISQCYLQILLESKSEIWRSKEVSLRIERPNKVNGHSNGVDEEAEGEAEPGAEKEEEEPKLDGDIQEDEHKEALYPADVSMVLLSNDERRVILRGYQDKVALVRQELEKTIAELDKYERVILNIPQKVHSQLIGAKRFKLLRMQKDFGVQIEFPNREAKGDSAHIVVVMGPSSNVDEACNNMLDQAQELLERGESRSVGRGGAPMRTGGVLHFNGVPEPPAKSEPGIVVVGAPWSKGQEAKASGAD